jgi:hypothetical protein
MTDLSFINQAALGTTSAVQMKTVFTGLLGGNSYALKCVSGSVAVGKSNAVTSSNGWPLAAGEGFAIDGQTLRELWVIGGAADRIAVMVVS